MSFDFVWCVTAFFLRYKSTMRCTLFCERFAFCIALTDWTWQWPMANWCQFISSSYFFISTAVVITIDNGRNGNDSNREKIEKKKCWNRFMKQINLSVYVCDVNMNFPFFSFALWIETENNDDHRSSFLCCARRHFVRFFFSQSHPLQ